MKRITFTKLGIDEIATVMGPPGIYPDFTDAEILEWVIRNQHCRLGGRDRVGWIVYDDSNGLEIITTRHETFRGALREAMSKQP